MTTKIVNGQEKTSEIKLPTAKTGTLFQLFEYFSAEEDVSVQCSLVDAFLHTYKIFSTTEQVLLTADRRFWDTCYSAAIPAKNKLKEINALRLLLSRWLRQPHVRHFDSHCGLAELHRFTSIVVGWYWVFHQRSAASDSDGGYPGSWTARYMDKSPQALTEKVSRILFSSIDKRSQERMAYKLDCLCKHAEYRAKELQSKYSGSESTTHTSRTTLSTSQLISLNRVRKISAPPCDHTELQSGLDQFNVAEQLTIIDQELFMKLLLPELLNNVRNRPCPTYTATVEQFNRVVNMVQCSVLRLGPDSPIDPINGTSLSPTPRDGNAPLAVAVWSNRNLAFENEGKKTVNNSMETFCEAEHKRAKIISQWIDVAWRLRQLNNLNSLQAVLVALQIGAIRRLRHCWTIVEILYTEHYRRFENLNSLMDISENHERVRKHMRKHLKLLATIEQDRRKRDDSSSLQNARGPFGMIPYLGIFMSDLTFLHTAHPDYVTDSPKLSTNGSKSSRAPSPVTIDAPLGHTLKTSSASSDSKRKNNRGLNLNSHSHTSKSRSRSRLRENVVDPSEEKLINFSKHVREANTLRDIYLLQYSASYYDLKPDLRFQLWFEQFPKLTESEAMERSLLIEPKESGSTVTSAHNFINSDSKTMKKAISDIQTWSSSQISSTCSEPRRIRSRSYGLIPRNIRRPASSNPSSRKRVNDIVASPADSPYHSSSDIDSVTSSPSTKSVTSHLLRSRSQRKKTSQNFLQVPPNSRKLSTESRFSRSPRGPSPVPSDLTVHVTMQDPKLSIPKQFNEDSQAFFKHVAQLGSTPNLIAYRKTPQNACDDSPSVFEKVLSTDSVADLVARVVTKLGLQFTNTAQYDLIVVQVGSPDIILPMDENAVCALRRVQITPNSTSSSNQPEIIECVLVHRIRGTNTLNLGNCRPLHTRMRTMTYADHRLTAATRRQPLQTAFDLWSVAKMPS